MKCENPILKADYFIVNATTAPIYYKLLGVNNLSSFRKKFGFDPEDRAKTLQSGIVATSNLSLYWRQMRRYATVFGVVWESRDSKDVDYLKELFSDKHDSIQVIASNPNGLLSYFAGDGKGNAVDCMNVMISVDHTRTLDDLIVRVARNCLFCHAAKGIVPFKDAVRDISLDISILASDKTQAEKLADLFGGNLPFEKDQATYQEALMKATGVTPQTFEKQFIKIYQAYYADLTLKQVAVELGMKEDDLKQLCRFSSDVYLLSLFKFDKISRVRFEDVTKDW